MHIVNPVSLQANLGISEGEDIPSSSGQPELDTLFVELRSLCPGRAGGERGVAKLSDSVSAVDSPLCIADGLDVVGEVELELLADVLAELGGLYAVRNDVALDVGGDVLWLLGDPNEFTDFCMTSTTIRSACDSHGVTEGDRKVKGAYPSRRRESRGSS